MQTMRIEMKILLKLLSFCKKLLPKIQIWLKLTFIWDIYMRTVITYKLYFSYFSFIITKGFGVDKNLSFSIDYYK